MLETEDKYRVHNDFALPDLHGLSLADGQAVEVREPRPMTLVAVYHDTSDLRLARRGITLRHRSGDGPEGWQLKLPVPGSPGTRHELDEPGSLDCMPVRFRAALTAHVRHSELGVRAMLRTDRATFDIVDREGQLLAELTDDRVEAWGAAGRDSEPVARFRELEVEDKGGGSAVLDAVGNRLLAAGAVQGEFRPKAVRALGAAATAAPDPPWPDAVRRRDPVGAVATSLLRGQVNALMDRDVAVRLGDDDGVHQLRVAARRLRSTLRDFDQVVDPTWSHDLQQELRWLGGALSGARDAEVVRARLEESAEDLLEADRQAALVVVRRALDARADVAASAVADVLDSERYVGLVDRLVSGAASPPMPSRDSGEGTAERPAKLVLPQILHASRKRLRRRVRKAAKTLQPADLHRARISAKRTRYLAESLVPIYGKPAKAFAARVESLQDLLGRHQDAVVAASVLREVAGTSRSPRAAFALGLLAAREQQQMAGLRAEFSSVGPKASASSGLRWARP